MKQNFTTISLLRELSLTFGPSGCEDAVADLIRERIAGYYDELIPDRMGGVIALIRGSGNVPKGAPARLMLSCHMDEVGFMIREITEDGLLKITSLMGRDTRVLAGRRVLVGNENGQVRGVMGVKPIHLLKASERETAPEMDDLYVDIGAENREEAEQYVHPGDYGTFESDFVRFGQDGRCIKGKALDDRIGCAVLCSVMRTLFESDTRPPCDVYFAFTCREELGISGAQTAAYKIAPTHAIVFEATAIGDIADTPAHRQVAHQGKGPAISLMDRGTVYDREFTDFVTDTAKRCNIPFQYKQYVSGGNDAGHIHKTRAGVKCAAISAPARYIHTASNVVAESDVLSMVDLANAVIRRLAEEK